MRACNNPGQRELSLPRLSSRLVMPDDPPEVDRHH